MNAVVSILDARRAKALESFRAQGVPHRRVEEWKYSDLRSILDLDVPQREVEEAAIDPFAGIHDQGFVEGQRFLITNGVLRNGMPKLPDGVEAFDLSSSDAPDWVENNFGKQLARVSMAEAALAFSRGGVALHVRRNVTVEQSLHVLLAGGGFTRLLIVLEDGARLTLLESFSENTDDAEAEYFSDIRSELVIGRNTELTHIRLAPRETSAILVETIGAKVDCGASYRAHFANFGAKLSRTEVHIALEGEGAEAHLSGVSVLDDAHADITTHVTHAVGNTQSRQLFKKVARGKSRGIYQGKVTVAQGADGSDSLQSAKGLLLSERAEIDLKPELEIFADDVKCAHGAAVGDLDLESLFYLQSRGIPEAEARSLLIRAFLGDAIEEVENEDIRATIWNAVDAALETML